MAGRALEPDLSDHGAPLDPPYHPVELDIIEGDDEHSPYGVMLRVNGNTSWLQTIALDANPKMQFMVAINKVDPAATATSPAWSSARSR